MIRPPCLKLGDIVGIAAPATAQASTVPTIDQAAWQRGLETLHQLGFQVRIAPHALEKRNKLDIPAYARAEDLNILFADESVKAIFCVSGGWGSHAVLPFLEWSEIKKQPKIFMGYSNITALLIGIASRTQLVTFHGPTILDGLSEFPKMLPYTRQWMARVICRAEPPGRILPPAQWTTDIPREDSPRQMQQNAGWLWLRPGHARGRLLGGNLSTLLCLAGTNFWPSFRDTIFFIEEVPMLGNSIMGIESIAGSLAQLQLLGVFDEIAGLIVGKIESLSEEEHQLVDEILMRFVGSYSFPVLTRVDLGHTDPKMTLPIGVQATLDAQQDSFSIDEAAVTFL